MFKKIVLTLLSVLVGACTQAQQETETAITNVHYGKFTLTIPTMRLESASILSVDGPVIRFEDEVSLGGAPATRELLELPVDFDLTRYPRYVFHLESTDGMPEDLQHLLDTALQSFGINADAEIMETPYRDGIIYSACSHPSCLIFATQNAQDEHILMLYPEGLTRNEILGFMGVQDAE